MSLDVRGEEAEAPGAYRTLLERMAQVNDVQRAAGVLGWDQRTYMPPGGAEARGEQLATLNFLAHRMLTSQEVGELLEGLRGYESSLPCESDEASLIRVSRRRYEQATKVPAELVAEQAMAASAGYRAWVEARQAKDYAIFRPKLEVLIDIARRIAQALGYQASPMDALIDLSEPGLTASKCLALFAELRETLVPLAAAVGRVAPGDEDALIRQRFPSAQQMACGLEAVRAIGFDLERRGRADLTVHPFTTSFDSNDVRITTRVQEDDFGNCFYSLLHEAGHGIYMQGVPGRFRRTALGGGASSGAHESQSRLWENVVGRSREFWQFFLPVARRHFPAQFEGATVDQIYRAVNRVVPSLIRTEADEVTYNLHVMLRFELETEMLEGRLGAAELRDAWNERMRSYLGLTPPTDLEGVLQDVHWTRGPMAAFQGYTLGNVIALQLYEAARAACPAIPASFARGDFVPLFEWMRAQVHEHGAKFTPEELVERATGKALTAKPYLDYIKAKYAELYGL